MPIESSTIPMESSTLPKEPNEMLQQQLAEQLRDIALPETVSWWPLAFGWWLLIALGLVLVSIIIKKMIDVRKQNQYRQIALADLQRSFNDWQENSNPTDYLHASNAILKRVVRVLEKTPASASISKSGAQWGETLNYYAKHTLPEPALLALTTDCYQANPTVDITALHSHIQTWLKTHPRVSDA